MQNENNKTKHIMAEAFISVLEKHYPNRHNGIIACELETEARNFCAQKFGVFTEDPVTVWNKIFPLSQREPGEEAMMMRAAPTLYASMILALELLETLNLTFPDAGMNKAIETMKQLKSAIEGERK